MNWPFARWLPLWREPGVPRADLLAGLTGAIVVLPQALAFATLAGLPPQHGLYAAIVPCLLAALFGSSRLMVSGPANAISLMTLSLVAPLAVVGSAEYVGLVLSLSFLVGVLQILLGLARIGALVDKVPHSVIVGFTFGAALLIINSQLGAMLGIDLPRGGSVINNLQAAWARLNELQWPAPIATLCTVLAAVLWRPYAHWVSALLVAMVAGSLVAIGVQHAQPQWPVLVTVGALPSALPVLSWPSLSLDTVRSLFGPTLVLTLVALTEAVAVAKAVARRYGDTLDGNQEFIGQGVANVAGAFCSAMPASGSFNRSGVNAEAGARTPFAAASAAVILLVLLMFVAPLAQFLPMAVVGGLLLVVAFGLLDMHELARIWREQPLERVPLWVTLIATVTLSLEWAILLGITSALLVRRRKLAE